MEITCRVYLALPEWQRATLEKDRYERALDRTI